MASYWDEAPLGELIEHILASHHGYLREHLPRLASALDEVRRAHGDRDGARLAELDGVFSALKDELEAHIRKEEVVLFPAILRSEGWIGQPIAAMEHEHDSASRALAELRRLTRGYQPPPHACDMYRTLFDGLADLDRDLQRHMHLENHILFPRAMGEMNRSRGC